VNPLYKHNEQRIPFYELFGVLQPGTLNPELLNLGKTNEPMAINVSKIRQFSTFTPENTPLL